MGAAAAIFDLDRTLLRGSSTPTFYEALWQAGVTPTRGFPGLQLMVRSYEVFGETLPAMGLAFAASVAARGHSSDEVRKAAETAAGALLPRISPWAPPLLAVHRGAGRRLVLATASPRDLVVPLAERLGFDAVIATRWATHLDGGGQRRFTGAVDGPFVWGTAKLRAVRRWAGAAGVELRGSWAYSDSLYDLPLLSAVGHPTAVNPDLRLQAVATLRRWPVTSLDAPPGVPTLLGAELQDALRLLSTRAACACPGREMEGADRIPKRGAVIVAAEAGSWLDVVASSRVVYQAGRTPRLVAPWSLLRVLGAVAGDAEAEAALRAGECLLVVGGPAEAARLAAVTGAPVVRLGPDPAICAIS